jgi:hypothetical protein
VRLARGSKRTRALFTEEIRNALQLITDLTSSPDEGTTRSRAILTNSALVGAIGLARATSGAALSGEILETVGEFLKEAIWIRRRKDSPEESSHYQARAIPKIMSGCLYPAFGLDQCFAKRANLGINVFRVENSLGNFFAQEARVLAP